MQLHDLAQAIPGIVVAVLLPGFALATLLVPHWRWWERLGAAPGLSAGFIGVFGLGLHLVHIPFAPATVLPAILLLSGAAFMRLRRTGAYTPAAAPHWVAIPALVAGGVAAGVYAWALHGQVIPPDIDPRVHGGLAATIARAHDVLPLFPIPLEGTSFAQPRPGFEAMAAVVSWLGGPSAAASMAPIITLVLVLLPLAITMLALEGAGSVALAVVAPLLAIGLAFPADQAILGRYPQVIDSTLVVPFLIAVLRTARGQRLRDNALILMAATASIWVIHGVEVLTALVVGGGLLAAASFAAVRANARHALGRLAAAGASVVAGAALVTLLTRLPHGPPALRTEPSQTPPPGPAQPLHVHDLVQHIAQADLTSPIAVALYCAGVAAVLLHRRMLWALVGHLVVILVMVDSQYTHHLEGLWTRVDPWTATDRLLGVQFWLLPLIMGAGLLAILAGMRALTRDRRTQLWASAVAVAIALAGVLLRHQVGAAWKNLFGASQVAIYPFGVSDALTQLVTWSHSLLLVGLALLLAWVALCRGLALPAAVRARLGSLPAGADVLAAAAAVVLAVSLFVGGRADLKSYQFIVDSRQVVTAADVAVLARMSAQLPPSTILINAPNDAGMWATGLSTLTPLVPNGFESGPLSAPIVIALSHACEDPGEAARALSNGDAIFVGSRRLSGTDTPWDVDCIARLPGLRLIASAPYGSTRAAGFVVTR